MADLNFPSSPTLYQQYSLNGQTFVWDGKRWKFTASSVVSISSGSAITSINNLITTEQFFATGDQGSLFNISSSGSTHTFNIPIAGIASTGLVSTLSQSFGGIKTFTNDLIISSSTSSTSPSTGALTISGGVGIGGSLFLSSLFPSSLSGIVVNNGVITSGSWSGSTITEFYGGTGYNSYTKGDILVGAGNTFIKLNVGSDNFVLTALSSSSTGLTWSPTSATGLTTLNGLSVGIQNLSFGYSGSVPAFSSSGSTHTLNIPLAGIASTGLVSTLAQSFAGIKTFTNAVSITDNTGSGTTLTGALIVTGGVGIGNSINLAGSLNFWNPASTYFVSLKSGITTASTIYTLPPYYPSFGQSVLSADTNGNLSWVLVSANAGQGTVATGAQYQIAGYYSGTAASVSGSSTFTNNLATNSVFINHTTASTATTNGALVVSGGVGISGQLSYNTALIGNTGVSSTPTMTFIGTNGDPIKLRVLDDSTLAFSGSQGQLFSINPVLNTGYIFSVNDISGVPLIRANADATVSMAEFAGNVGIGLSNPAFKLQVLGNAGISGTAFISNTSSSISTTSGALTVLGGVGIGGSLYVAGASNISSVIFNSGIIYGTLVGSATSAGFATTSNYSHISGFGITSGFATTSAYSHQSGYAITSGSSITSGFASTAGLATTATNINVVSALSNASHPILFTPTSGSASGAAISSEASFVYNPFTDILSVSGLAVTSGTVATNFSSGALIVAGGVGIGGSLFVNGDLTINGTTTTINSVTLTVDDKNIELGSVSSPSDVTAEGGGITLRGTSDKFINWYTGTGWSSSESWNLASGNTYKINNISVLSATSLGTGVTNSSLTAVGTITTGVWAATAITALYGGTGLVPAFNVGDILYANTSTTWGRLSASSNSGYVLASAGSGVTPTYVAPSTLSVGLATTANYSHQSGYAITSGSSALATTANYAHQSGYAITSGFATTSAYSHQSGYAITSGSSGTATTATYSHLSGFAVTSGLATTANYAHQSGYATTSGLSGLATTATYAHQSGYAITSGSSATATTATYAHQSGFAITSGFATTAGLATTATYAHQSGYGLTSGFAQTATYSSQSGYGLTAGLATSSTSSFINSANTNTSHPIIFAPITGSSSGSGLSINTTLNYNPSTNILYSSGLAVTASTLSTSSSSGALIVTGGIGVGSTSYFRTDLNVGNSTQGRLYFSQATLGSAGTTVIPSMAFIGTTNSPITLSVLPDNSLSFDGSSGQLFSINNNLSTGWIFSINDISGLPIFRANADLTVSMGEYGGNTGIGLSNPSYKLHVAGDTNLSSGYVYRINGNSVLSSSSLGTGITNSNLTAVGTITTGTWSGSAITSLYGGTGYQTYSTGDLLVGTGSTLSKLSVGANNFILVADNAVVGGVKWANVSGVAITNINGLTASKQDLAFGYLGTVPAFASSGNTHTLNIPIAGSGSTGLVSTQAQTFAGQKTFTSAIIGDLVGTATTSGFATTASYAHQSGYGLTSGFATTANYSHQSGYGLTSGFATTANYANQSGYATTSGLATTATYSHQSGYAITSGSSNTSGLATTATNINVVSASTSASHSVLFTPASGTASGAALSTESTFVYNPSTDILSVSGLAVTATTTSTNSGTGALRVAGGVGISGELNLNNNTSTSNFAFFSGSTNQPANVTIQNTFSGSSAASQLTLNNNDSSSFVLIGVGSTNNSFIPAFYGSIIPTNFGYIIGGGGFGANSGGLSVGAGSTLILFAKGSGHRLTLSGTGLSIFANVSSTSTTSGALTVSGGAGIGGSIFGGSTISAADNIEIRSGKELRFNNVGNSSYTGFKAGANAVNTTYTLPTAFPGSGTSVLQSDTSGTLSWIGIVGLATTAIYSHQSGYAITSGTATSATTAQNVHLGNNATSDLIHRLVTSRSSGAGGAGVALSGSSIFYVIPSDNLFVVSGTVDAELVTALEFNAYSDIGSTSPTSGALRVANGAGIGQSVSIGGRLQMFNGANYTAFVSSASGNTVYTFPATSPATGTSVLQSNSAGLMSWVGIVGNATTATYALQSGYAITSGLATSAGFATTATYAHQSGYAITSGFATTAANINIVATTSSDLHLITFSPVNGGSGVGLSTTSLIYVQPDTGFLTVPWLDAIQIDGINVTATNFSGTAVTAIDFYGPLTGNVTGTATTATYAHQSGYATTSGSSNTSGYATTSGTATTATNVNVVSAATNSSHPILFTPTQGTASGTAASSSGPLSYNPFSSILSVSGLAVTAATPSTGFNSGALIVAGGVGIGGSLYVNGDLTINGTTTTINSVTLTVDDKNIELGSVASPSDATAEGGGITLRGSTDKSINWYSGVGWSSSESWNLASGNTFKINGTSVLSSSSLGTGVTNSSLTALGIITTGTWSGSTITAYYGGTGYNSYTKGDILVGAGNTFIKLNVGSDNFVLTASSTSATGLTWAQTAATGITTLNSLTSTQQYFATGTSGSGFNISSSGSTHTFNIPIAGTGTTGLVSTLAQSFAGVKTFTNDVIISSSTASTFVRNGALQVYGGVGISGQLSFNQAAMGFTGILTNPSIAFIGTTGSPITLSVLADNSLSFEGSSGQLFSIDNNLTTGEIFAVSDISGLPIISAYANQNVTIGEFGGNLGIGLSNPSYKLHVIGSVGFTSNIASTSTSTGTLVVNGGVGIGGSLNVNSASSISGVRLDSGIIYGNLVGTATTAGFASTSNYANQSGFAITSGIATTATYAIQSGYAITSGSSSTANTASYAHVSGFAITSGFATTATYAHQSGYAITSGSSGLATTATYAHQSGYAITSGSSGLATTANNINVVSASTSASHPVLFTPATGTASGAALSTESTFVYNPSTDILSVSGLAITSGTASTSPTTGALVVAGGVGIGGTLRLGTQIVGAPNPFIAGFAGSTSGFVSLAIQNTENGILSRSGIQILNNSGWAAIDLFASGSLFANRLTITNNAGSIHYSATDVHNFIVSTLIMAINGTKVSISPTTASTNTTSGALTVSGGVGIGGSVFTSSSNASSISGVILNNGAITNTGTITSTGVMSLSNSSTTALSIKDGSNNTKFNVDTVGGIVSVSSSTTSTNTTSGAFVVTGGVGIGGSLYVASATAISGVTINAGVITGSLVGTATTSGFASTSSYSHQSGYAITSGSSSTSGYATTSDYSHQSGFAITSGFATTATYAHTSGFAITSGLATTASYAHQSGFAITSGFATTAAYSYTSGYGITSGLATTATYAHQSGFALTATTSTNSTFSTLTADTTNATRRLIFSANGTGSTSLYNTSTLFTNPFNSSVGASVFTGSGSVNIRPGIDATNGVSIGNSTGTPYVYFDTVNGRIGINQPTPLYDLHIVGEISATNKSFVIDHPTKANMMLRHGSLEGPENGVYVRGKLVNENIIQLPEYWLGLVDEETITVSLTPVGKDSKPYIEKIENYKVYVNVEIGIVNCHFVVYGERKDIPKLDVEY